MSKEIEAIAKDIDLSSQHITATPFGLIIEGQPSPDELVNSMLKIQGGELLMQFYKADLAACAESLTTGWGQSKYDALAARFDSSSGTLANLASIGRRYSLTFRQKLFTRSREVFSLSMEHFKVVQGMTDEFAEYWIIKAAENQWGRDKFRNEIREWKESRGEVAEKAEPSAGEVSFKEQMKEFFSGFSPRLSSQSYDKKSWLLEVRDVIDEELESLGIINGK
jgi:hypothetical protein